MIFRFDESNMPELQPLVELVSRRPKEFFLPNPDKPRLHFKLEKPEPGKEPDYFRAVREAVEILLGGK